MDADHLVLDAQCAGVDGRLLIVALRRGRRRIIAFYPEVRVCEMSDSEVRQWDPEGDSFVNVNTPDEWRQVRNRFGA